MEAPMGNNNNYNNNYKNKYKNKYKNNCIYPERFDSDNGDKRVFHPNENVCVKGPKTLVGTYIGPITVNRGGNDIVVSHRIQIIDTNIPSSVPHDAVGKLKTVSKSALAAITKNKGLPANLNRFIGAYGGRRRRYSQRRKTTRRRKSTVKRVRKH